MAIWNDRLLPFPVLAPRNDDYGESKFVATVPAVALHNGKDINLTIKYHLTSPTLKGLIAEGKATYVSLVVCESTWARDTYVSGSEDDVQVLKASDYADALVLTPYVISTGAIAGFSSEEHAGEIKGAKPEGFDIPSGGILAVGKSTRIVLKEGGSLYSAFNLVGNDSIGRGEFKVALDDNRIQIHVAPQDKAEIEALRLRDEAAVLHSALYLHAVVEALRYRFDFPQMRWAMTMQQALERHSISASDPDEWKEQALDHAQILMGRPVGVLLDSFVNREED